MVVSYIGEACSFAGLFFMQIFEEGVMRMAQRGRKPTPTAIKELEGNPGKRPHNENETVPPKGEIK